MARISKAISDQLFEKCKIAFRQQRKASESGRRLQAIISAKHHGISKVASIFHITRATLMKWITDFERESIGGLEVKKGRGRKRIFTKDHESRIHQILKENHNITGKELQNIIKRSMSLDIGIATVYRLMHRLGFSYITPRKNHYKQDKEKLESFKKKSAK
jgi:transposase